MYLGGGDYGVCAQIELGFQVTPPGYDGGQGLLMFSHSPLNNGTGKGVVFHCFDQLADLLLDSEDLVRESSHLIAQWLRLGSLFARRSLQGLRDEDGIGEHL